MKSIFLSLCLCGFAAQAFAQGTYRKLPEISIGGNGGWDYLSIDDSNRKLFMSHFDKVVVVDLGSNQIVGNVEGTKGVHGVAIATDLGKGFSSNGMENTVTVFDLKTYKELSKIVVGENPDAILYIPQSKEVYVFNGKSHSFSAIDAATNKVKGTYPLSGKPEFAVWQPRTQTVYVNIEDTNSLVAIDAKNHQVKATWKLNGCESPSGLAIDANSDLLFSVCENEVMVMTDGLSGKVLSSMKIGKGSDGVIFDAGKGLAVSANGEGTLSVGAVKQGKLVSLEVIPSEVGARTIALDPQTHKIYLPTASFQPHKSGEKRSRPVNGSQKLLVYGHSQPE